MLSCRDATALMEKRHREEISFAERIQLAVHVTLCAACRRYQKQSAWLEGIFRSRDQQIMEEEVDQQAGELEEKILRQLEENE